MEHKFKVGDKIRRIDNNGDNVRVGDIVTVSWIDNYGNVGLKEFPTVFNSGKYCVDYFELVEEKCSEKCEPCYNPIKEYADRMSRMLSEATDSRYGLIGELGDIEVYESKNLPIKNKTIMSKITTFAKNLVLSADEKLLRKYGLKNECGEFTDEAESLVINKLVKENEAYLIELAKAMEVEETKK